jgi:hypothetical protein
VAVPFQIIRIIVGKIVDFQRYGRLFGDNSADHLAGGYLVRP